MEIKRLTQNEIIDFRKLVEIFKVVFENDEPISDQQHLGKLLSDPNFMVFVVKQHDEIVGGLTIYVLHRYYGSKPIAYIYDVGVKPEYQGKGLGKALIREVCNYCKENGFEDAYVEAELDDTDAIDFYRKTNHHKETTAIIFTYILGT